MTKWYCDTCDCILSYNPNGFWIKTFKKCRLHKRLDGQNLLDQVLNMNRRFNMALGINPTDIENDEITVSKEINVKRIRTENLDNYHEHLPEHHDLTFFENLKRLLGRLNPL